jgi:uncharacterized protein YggE
MMKRCSIILIISFASSLFCWSGERRELHLITVVGEAKVNVEPDEILLKLGIETRNRNIMKAKNDNDKRVRAVFALAKKYKIKPSNIKTEIINVEPIYKYQSRAIIGYFVQKTIVLRMKYTFKSDDMLSSLLKAGVNRVYGIYICDTELWKYRNQARILAIKDAREKAIDMAEELGQKVGKPHRICEKPFDWQNWQGSYNEAEKIYEIPHGLIRSALGLMSSFSPGRIRIKARVLVSFELKDI